MSAKEAKARIKINKLLEEAGWRFDDDENGKSNIILENGVKITKTIIDSFGENFEKTTKGFIDYLLLDARGYPFLVLEAKKEEINPLDAKEQARTYAIAQNCRFIILSNGSLHYLWDLKSGNPSIISRLPAQKEVVSYCEYKPTPDKLRSEKVDKNYIALTQKPEFEKSPLYLNEHTRDAFTGDNNLSFLRKYQLRAIQRIQEETGKGKNRFLFEMATGTGKTLTAAAAIKLFHRSGNATRTLFLVDRLELETQADKALKKYLKNDLSCCIFKENKDDWRRHEIVVTTVQSLLFNNKYKRIFSPADFKLIISDESHRSIGGNARTVFEYFFGFKLGLTATPKTYLKMVDTVKLNERDPRELERRMLLDTYTTFGCEGGRPTFQYTLLDGVKDGYLVNPVVVDARTDITTQLLADKGYTVLVQDEEGNDKTESYSDSDFEKKFFSVTTNRIFCETFLKNAVRDPVTGELGKTIIFCVSQNHAGKIVEILNELGDKMYPGKYSSDFALQVTSRITDAQQFTINFANNNLSGTGNFNPLYKTSKTRICVTVGMMTTGYDCQDIMNICLMRPIFSPTDFVQIKGRGTRKWNFSDKNVLIDKSLIENLTPEQLEKKNFKLFDFFANCEFFEVEFDYDEVIQLPVVSSSKNDTERTYTAPAGYDNTLHDPLQSYSELQIGSQGMKIDRKLFQRFEDTVKEDAQVQKMVQEQNFEAVEKYIINNIFDKPTEYYNLEKLRQAVKIDRRVSLREMIQKIYGLIPFLKNKDELLEEEFDKFDSRYLPDEKDFNYAKHFFKSYITDSQFREIIESRKFEELNTNPNEESFRKLSPELRNIIPEYIKDNVPLNQFMV